MVEDAPVMNSQEMSLSFRFIKELGLPTFFAVIMLGLVIYQAKLQTQIEVEMVRSSQIKIDMLRVIEGNQVRILANQERAETKFNLEWDTERHFEGELERMEGQQLDILRRLDSIFIGSKRK